MHHVSFRVGLVVALATAAGEVRAGGAIWINQISTDHVSASRALAPAASGASVRPGSSSSQPLARTGDAHWEFVSLNSARSQVFGETLGSNNSLTVRQDGLGNALSIVQSEAGNTMTLTQTGEGQTLTAIQSGQQNAMSIQQAGSSNVVNAVQSGTMNAMGIAQTGSGNRTIVVQR